MRIVLVLLKILGTAAIALPALNSLRHFAMYGRISGQTWVVVPAVLITLALLYWAYRVVWRPLRS